MDKLASIELRLSNLERAITALAERQGIRDNANDRSVYNANGRTDALDDRTSVNETSISDIEDAIIEISELIL